MDPPVEQPDMTGEFRRSGIPQEGSLITVQMILLFFLFLTGVGFADDGLPLRPLGTQSLQPYSVVGIGQSRDLVFVAINRMTTAGVRGRLVKYPASSSGKSMFNVGVDGLNPVPGYQSRAIGYQDYDSPLSSMVADDNGVFVAKLLSDGTSMLLHTRLGGTGASMFCSQL